MSRGHLTLFAVRETSDPVAGVRPALVTRFLWRAERQARRLNAVREVDYYRWEVVRLGDRWSVVAMQNVAVPL